MRRIIAKNCENGSCKTAQWPSHIEAADIEKLLGFAPNELNYSDKSTKEWEFTIDGEEAAIYDWKGEGWSIYDPAEKLGELLTRLTTPQRPRLDTICPKCSEDVYRNTSFNPDRLALQSTIALQERVAELYAKAREINLDVNSRIISQEYIDGLVARHIKFTQAFWAASSRTASPMITGPANFPTARNIKARKSEMNRYEEMQKHFGACFARMLKSAFPCGFEGDPIQSNNPNALELLKTRLDSLTRAHEQMKAANALGRKHKGDTGQLKAALAGLGFGEKAINEILRPNTDGSDAVFQGFYLTNNLAKIRATEDRIAALERTQARGVIEERINEHLLIVQDPEQQRIRLEFGYKPEKPLIAELKRKGFRWSPSRGAWQRHLNNNGRYAAKEIVKFINQTAEG